MFNLEAIEQGRSDSVEECLRIFCVANQFSPIVGGAEVQAEKHARRLQALGHDVTVVTLRIDKKLAKKEALDGLRVVRVGGIYRHGGELRTGKLGHAPIMISMFLALWRLRHSYDMIHAFQFSPIAAIASFVGEITHKPVVINLQSAGPGEARRRQLEQGATLMADTLDDADYLKIDPSIYWVVGGGDIDRLPLSTPGSRFVVNFLRRSKTFYRILSTRGYSYLTSRGFRAEQIVCIPNGVSIEKFRPAAERRPDAAKPERDIICVARLEYPKGVDVLLHAWGRMMRAPADWRGQLRPRLYVVGAGIFRPQMERIISELSMGDSVELLGLQRDVVDLLQRSWGFVMPSRWEGMPNALLEAMACGLPCIATRVSGSEDIVSDGFNGLLVEPEQPAEMARALRRVIEDTDLAHRLGIEGRATIMRDYRLETVVERCLELYRSLLGRSKRGDAEAECAREVVQAQISGKRGSYE
jgi:glycosyltransferase involved in cell wall biosynthesis